MICIARRPTSSSPCSAWSSPPSSSSSCVHLSPFSPLPLAPADANPLSQATLVAYPRSRKILFPPIPPPPGKPPSATDPTNQKGDESLIAGVGDPVEHRSRAEQIEEQAWEFTNLVQRFGARVVVGGRAGGKQGNAEVGRKRHVDDGDDSDDDELDSDEQDLHEVAQTEGLGAAADKENKEKKLSDKQRAKQKAKEAKIARDAKIGKLAKGVQDGLGNAADLAEVFAKCVSLPLFCSLASLSLSRSPS